MRFTIFILLFILFSFSAGGQTGHYLLSHYTPEDKNLDNVSFDMAQDEKGLFFFATKAGVLEFDGRNWELIPGNSAIYTLHPNESGEIFWGGATGFGKISRTQEINSLQLLSDKTTKNIFQSLSIAHSNYFLNEEALFIYSTTAKNIGILKSTERSGAFTSLFELYDVAYVTTEKDGIYKISQGKFVPPVIPFPENTSITFTTRHEKGYILGTTDNRIFFCSPNLQVKEIKLEDQLFINASVIVSGTWVNEQLIAVGTLRGGVVFINPNTGKTEEIVNYSTGLPDNEIYALMGDRNQNVWVAHDFGFTRISPYIPFRSFSHYPGLQGNLHCAVSFKNTVYVGTSLGLFSLQKEDVYEDIEYYVDVPVKKQATVKQVTPESETDSKKKGFLNFLKRSRDKTETLATLSEEKKPGTVRHKKTQRILRSTAYEYKKIAGINAKVTQLIQLDGRLVAVGLGGVFEVNGQQAKTILEDPVRYAFASEKKNILVLATYDDAMLSLLMTPKGWQSLNLFDRVGDHINYIFEGEKDELWLCALTNIYRADISDLQVQNIQTIDFSNPDFDKTIGINQKGKIILANSDGFFAYTGKNTFSRIDSLPAIKNYFSVAGNLWYHDEHEWNLIGPLKKPSNLHLLNLFSDVRFITSEQSANNLWIITGNNELFKFYGDRVTPYETAYPLFLKKLLNGDKKIIPDHVTIIDQEHSALLFEVIQPDYFGPQSTEYRYKLNGLNANWSPWSAQNNVIDFPYLPLGDYTMEVQSKDIFGNINDMKAVVFEVLPPYWQRPWFYAMEFAIVASFVMLSFKLNTRYRFVSRLLSLFTIILLIQFIQTGAEATISTKTSPVLDFVIQLLIALLILPVEGFLRKLMLRSLESGGLFSKKSRPINTK